MLDRGQIKEIIYRAIERVNELLLDENVLTKEDTTILVGENSALDSMGFINFIVALEEELSQTIGLELNLMEESKAETVNSPQWSTVDELVDFLLVRAQKK